MTINEAISLGEDYIGEGLSKSLGRLSLPIKAGVFQERTLDDFREMSPEEAERMLRLFQKKHPGVLSDTKVRLGAAKPLDDVVRTIKNPRLGIPLKAIGIPQSLLGGALSWMGRVSQYNPAADTITVYGDYPEVLAHELGHAVDLNRKATDKVKDKWYGSLGRDAYLAGYMVSGVGGSKYLEGLHPMTLWTESMANRRAAEAVGDEQYSKARNLLWPAFSTYLTAAGIGSAALHHKYVHKGPGPSPWDRYQDIMYNVVPDSLRGTPAGAMLTTVLTTATVAIGARILAGIVSRRLGGMERE